MTNKEYLTHDPEFYINNTEGFLLEFFSNPYFNKGGLESFPSFQSFNLRTTYEMDERDEFQFYFARFIDAYYAGILFQYGLLDLVNGPLEL